MEPTTPGEDSPRRAGRLIPHPVGSACGIRVVGAVSAWLLRPLESRKDG